MPFLSEVDEEKLSQTERLALAWYRLNLGEWDEYIGKNRKVSIALNHISRLGLSPAAVPYAGTITHDR